MDALPDSTDASETNSPTTNISPRVLKGTLINQIHDIIFFYIGRILQHNCQNLL